MSIHHKKKEGFMGLEGKLPANYAVFDKLIQAGVFEPFSSRTVFDVEPAGNLANA